MTRKETMVQLEDLDAYFRIHGWCTQMNSRISSFMDALSERDKKYVQEWAYTTLGRENIKSASHIMAIIFLKLLNVSDKELIRLLYTVLSGRLTFEDFTSLNTYIFKGKPPLTRDLFYNITERVFIDKKTALLKALSISSIISEADPELTIFYMTMLLCRVDLNNENRAMLNLLLYCVDADIPSEVSEGVRAYLLSIQDILEEIFSSESDDGNRRVLAAVQAHMERETGAPGIISIEKKKEQRESPREEPHTSNNNTPSVINDFSLSGEEKNRSAAVNPANKIMAEPESKAKPEAKPVHTDGAGNVPVAGEPAPQAALPDVSQNTTQDTIHNTTYNTVQNISSDGFRESSLAASEDSFSREGRKETAGKGLVSKEVFSVQGEEKNRKENYGSSLGTKAVPKKLSPDAEAQVSGFPGIPDSSRESVPVEQYELKLRKFKLSDLFSGTKTVKKTVRKSARKPVRKPSKETDNVEKPDKGTHSGVKHTSRILVLIAAAAATAAIGWFLLKPAVPVPSAPVKTVKVTAVTEVPRVTEVESPTGWKLKETGRGVEWTVQKGESVWKLYKYLSSHVSELPGPLQSAGKMDWLPFIHQIIALNPQKSFAKPIEPGEVFLVLRNR